MQFDGKNALFLPIIAPIFFPSDYLINISLYNIPIEMGLVLCVTDI